MSIFAKELNAVLKNHGMTWGSLLTYGIVLHSQKVARFRQALTSYQIAPTLNAEEVEKLESVIPLNETEKNRLKIAVIAEAVFATLLDRVDSTTANIVAENVFGELLSISSVEKPIEYYACFMSYAHKDREFAADLHRKLSRCKVRCWFAPEDLKIGDHYHQRIDESIRLYDKLILILSENALQSSWVEREVVAAREREDREKRQVLFPLRLDNAVMDRKKAWATDVRRRWHIGDFTQWKDPDAFEQAFERLLRDLKKEDEET